MDQKTESTTSSKRKDQSAPYVPFRSFLTALDTLRQGHPPTLDPTIWPTFSGGLQRQMFAAFKFLGLIDETGAVREDLDALVRAEDRRQLIAKMLRNSYPALFELELSKATQNQFLDGLRNYNVAGTTLEKARSFFLRAAKHAQISLSPGIQHLSKPGAVSGKRRARNNAFAKSREDAIDLGAGEGQEEEKARGTSRTIRLQGGGSATLAFDVDVWSMTDQDQQFVFEMIRRMGEYEAKQKTEG